VRAGLADATFEQKPSAGGTTRGSGDRYGRGGRDPLRSPHLAGRSSPTLLPFAYRLSRRLFPRWEVMGQEAPSTAATHYVEDSVEDLAQGWSLGRPGACGTGR
jgi:hypothetical protein